MKRAKKREKLAGLKVIPNFLTIPTISSTEIVEKALNFFMLSASEHFLAKNTSDDWYTRMEDKLDKLSEAVYSIARMEELMLTMF